MIPCNTGLMGVRDLVRQGALQSFEFFANTVMTSDLPEGVCMYVQDLVLDKEDAFIPTKKPKTLTLALFGWLQSQGYTVLTTAKLPSHEVLHWLELGTNPDDQEESQSVLLDLCEGGVRLTWR